MDDPYIIELDEAIEVIEAKRKKDIENTIKIFEEDNDFQILKGRWGRPYLKAGKKNIPLGKEVDAEALSFEECKKLAEEYQPKASKKKGKK